MSVCMDVGIIFLSNHLLSGRLPLSPLFENHSGQIGKEYPEGLWERDSLLLPDHF